MTAHAKPYANVLETIGDTPLIRLNRVVDGARTPVYAKAEIFNPGASVKDRIAPAIIEAAEKAGALKPGGTIVEGTSGNTGVALAMAAAVKGYRARRRAEERPNTIVADQFYNPVNPQAHYESTGPEIWEQTEGRVTHFVASPGTGGTITGVARYLKERNPEIRVLAGDFSTVSPLLSLSANACQMSSTVRREFGFSRDFGSGFSGSIEKPTSLISSLKLAVLSH